MIKLLRSSILAGIAIGLAGFGFLASGIQSEVYGSIFGAILFSFGLLSVVGYKLRLYTGTAGFINKGEIGMLVMVLLGNIMGCFCSSLGVCCALPQAVKQSTQERSNAKTLIFFIIISWE